MRKHRKKNKQESLFCKNYHNSKNVIQNKIFNDRNGCPECNSGNYEKKGFRNQKQRYICKDCGRNWTSDGVAKNLFFRKTKTKDAIQRENTVKKIVIYLKNQEANNMPIKFWYRNDTKAREMHDYFIDDKYVQVRSDKGYYIKFLIDKIRKI